MAKAAATAKFLDGHASFSLLQESDDLLIGKSCGLNIRNSPEFTDLLLLPWYGWEGVGQEEGHAQATVLNSGISSPFFNATVLKLTH